MWQSPATFPFLNPVSASINLLKQDHKMSLHSKWTQDSFTNIADENTCFFFLSPVAHLGEHLKANLADVKFRVLVKALQRDRLSLQNWLAGPFDEQSGCMWTQITEAGYWSYHK